MCALSEAEVMALIDGLLRLRVGRRWHLDADVRTSAAHLAIAEALAAERSWLAGEFEEAVRRRFLSELRVEARREARRLVREVSIVDGNDGSRLERADLETPEVWVAARELAGLVVQRAREIEPRCEIGAGNAAERGRGTVLGRPCGARGAASRARVHDAAPIAAVTQRRWRARAREALRGAAREVIGR